MTDDNKIVFRPDDSQQKVIEATSGYHLVLAPPGCGKTQVLTYRIIDAHQQGVEYEDMLCLTFTNRAARGMRERIQKDVVDDDVANVYVGNVHRFCSRFLFNNNVIAAESSVIDEDDAISIMAQFIGEDEDAVATNYRRRREYAEIMQFAAFIYQIKHEHPKALRIHPECLSSDDIFAMRRICEIQRMAFDANAIIDIYEHVDFYRDASRLDAYDFGLQQVISRLLRKMNHAHLYADYKRDNLLIDFEDLLMLTYDALRADKEGKYKRYPWIQIDEVQDLNAIQMAIIDQLTAKEAFTVMYLGDEQQAIFSFMGAKVNTLNSLKERCGNNVHHLAINHRSPDYLLNVFNTYAAEVMKIDKALLPNAAYAPKRNGDELQIIRSDDFFNEVNDVADVVSRLYHDHKNDTVAVIVNSNIDAIGISNALKDRKLSHFRVSGDDLFASPNVKLLFAHLNIINDEGNFIAWARLLKGLKVFGSPASSRNFVHSLSKCAMLPSDFLRYDNSTYVQEFMHAYEEREIVVFDTETTGLNVFEDEIVQIAAVKIRRGEIVAGSEYCVFIHTDREIPLKLGDIDNPIIEELKHNEQLSHTDALQSFMDYAQGDVLLGHNVNYDYNILDNNLKRYLPEVDLKERHPEYYDSLRLAKLLEPGLKEYKLKHLLSVLHIEGENSHLADADVNATRGVVDYCYAKAKDIVDSQHAFMARPRVKECAAALRRAYADFYFHALDTLYQRNVSTEQPALVAEMNYLYDNLVCAGTIKAIDDLHYITNYLSVDIIDGSTESSLIEQLSNHIMEINTLKEADLCNSSSMDERIFVSTVHKAKGLEFDNVIVFDAVDGRYPNYFNQNNKELVAEDARKFYVAISRAKKRLYVSQCMRYTDNYGNNHTRMLTRFMNPIMNQFNG